MADSIHVGTSGWHYADWIGVEGTVPSFANLSGSVPIADSKAEGNSNECRNSSGGCSVGTFAPTALLLLAPLMLIRKQ